VSDWTVVVLPAVLVAGVVLIVLGVAAPERPRRAHPLGPRLAEWLVQAGVAGASPWHLIAFCSALASLAVRARHRRRTRELQEVWPDAIDNLASGVRAGLSLPEAVAGLADRGPEPLRPSFARFAVEYHATGRFGVALDTLKNELADPTADRVVEALRLARDVGGTELGRTLRTLANFLRDSYRVRKELEARQTWVVVAARLAFATPWVVLLMLSSKREAVAAYRQPGGALVLAVGAAMAVLGYRLMLRIGRIPREERVLR
jgi:tight adherence protein B